MYIQYLPCESDFCPLRPIAAANIRIDIIRWISPDCKNYDSSSIWRSFDDKYSCNITNAGWHWGDSIKTGPGLYFTSAQQRIFSPPCAVRICGSKAKTADRKEPHPFCFNRNLWRRAPEHDEDWLNRISKSLDTNFISIKNMKLQFANSSIFK